MIRHHAVCVMLASALAAAAASAVQAQGSFPARPITLVVPLPAGGTADLLCGFAADKMSGKLGQQVVVENRPGGAGGRVTTIAETLPGVHADTWMAVAAPARIPKELTRQLSEAISQGFRTPDLRARILALEAEPLGSTPQEMRKMIHMSEALWAPVVEAAKITID